MIKEEWDRHTGDSIFMKSEFLQALENTPPSGTSFLYGIVKIYGENIGTVYFQVKRINLLESLKIDSNGVFNKLKRGLAKFVDFQTLVVGNMTLTGSYGVNFKSEYKSLYDELIPLVVDKAIEYLKSQRRKIRGIILKDFDSENRPQIKNSGYAEFSVQPNMVMNIDPIWKDFDDYLSSMKSKYRTRTKRARKKAKLLTKRSLSLDEIKENNYKISELYKNVSNGAGFNLFTLPENYFWNLKKNLGNKMQLTAYYDGASMVGFYTSIQNNVDVDAHFLGYHPEYNRKCQIYLNMLYDLVDEAINLKADKLIMSRTAMEIKSSVGAKGHDMFVFMKSTNSIVNWLIPYGLLYFVPQTKWQARSPFP